jgi:hypothetical protein
MVLSKETPLVAFNVTRLIPRIRSRRRIEWVHRLPPEKARILSRNLRSILDPGNLRSREAARTDVAR